MTYTDIQNLNRATISYLTENLQVGMSLAEVRSICETYMLNHGADSFWYWDIGAFVFSGDETAVSVSGREYKTSDRLIQRNDILTVDLSPQCNSIWGDYARTIVVENGQVVNDINRINNTLWRRGLQTEIFLHRALMETVASNMTFEELYLHMNALISGCGFLNLDFSGNLGHSIVKRRQDRVYIEKGNDLPLSKAGMFTFEPHIGIPGSPFGFKREDIYYFERGELKRI